MRRPLSLLLLLAFIMPTHAAQLDPINIEIDPVVQFRTIN
jgi:hypothetical protein